MISQYLAPPVCYRSLLYENDVAPVLDLRNTDDSPVVPPKGEHFYHRVQGLHRRSLITISLARPGT